MNNNKDLINLNDDLEPKIPMEFKEGVTDDFSVEELSPVSRRKFMALVGASTAFAAVSCSDYRDKKEVVPYNKKPEEVTLGRPNFYASTCTACALNCGILIKTREGRPIKVDGNPDHPISLGKTCSIGQANILNLYDPSRIKSPIKINKSDEFFLFKKDVIEEKWNVIDKEITDLLKKATSENKEIAIISEPITSPTAFRLFEDFKVKYPTVKFYFIDLFDENNKKNAWVKSFGDIPMSPLNYKDAKIIVTLEADVLGRECNFLENSGEIISNRNAEKHEEFNRIYAVEAGMSLTGMNSDYRIRLNPAQQLAFVLSLVNELGLQKKAFNLPGNVENGVKGYSLDKFAADNKVDLKTLKNLAFDLAKNKGKSILVAGKSLPEEVHIAVNMLNSLLDNKSIYKSSTFVNYYPKSSKSEFESLISKMNSKQIGVLIQFDANPAYLLSSEYGYEAASKNVDNIISLTESQNESSRLSSYVLPINHNFEAWGDYQTRTGSISLQQPVIAPINNTRQKEAVLLNWMQEKPEEYKEDIYHKYLMARWEKEVFTTVSPATDFNSFWYGSLHDGIALLKDNSTPNLSFNFNAFNPTSTLAANGYTVVISKNYFLRDGKYATNGWLQELPHPVTKITWDNYAAMSLSTSNELGVKMNDLVEVSANGKKVTLPVLVQPGIPEKLIDVELGYGRTHANEVANNVGVNLIDFIGKDYKSKFIRTDATVTPIPGHYQLASTQEHHMLTEKFVKDLHLERGIIRETTLDEYIEDPKKLKEHGEDKPHFSIIDRVKYPGVKWAMAIDLNKCTGCSMCAIACNVENNIPVVGKEQVIKGREMSWMRLDRYYSGTDEDPIVSQQPQLCQHCDNAPCENVCPVVATTHSPDGLNQMTYNRCVGTRYCANNCPFKVRRYNFFDFREQFAKGYYEKDSLKPLYNPEVTVRSRGVMEKCTFCVQNIMDARSEATKNGKDFDGTGVKTACQISCPTEAIVFGNMNDPNSAVSKQIGNTRNYTILEEINVKPNINYLAKLRNTVKKEEV